MMKKAKTTKKLQQSTEEIKISRAEYEKFLKMEELFKQSQQQINALQSELNWVRGILNAFKRARFGASSEKLSKEFHEQLPLLFNEPEFYAGVEEILQDKAEEAENAEATEAGIIVKEHVRQPKRKPDDNILDNLPADTKIETREYYLDEDGNICPECGSDMEIIGVKEHRSLVIQPAQPILRIDKYITVACRGCNENGKNTKIITAPHPRPVLPGSYASPEAIAYLMTEKYAMGTPLYRMEQNLHRQGIPLSRQTMSNWLIKGSERWLRPLFDELHKRLLTNDIIHADETTVQVLHEGDKAPTSKSYMWVFRTGSSAPQQIVLYNYEPSRRAECAKDFLGDFHGYLQTDGYAGYHCLGPDIINVGCLTHARRKFYEIVESTKKTGIDKAAAKAVGYFTALSKVEKLCAQKTPEERYLKRQELAKPILDEFFAWLNSLRVDPKSRLGGAVTYMMNQKEYLYGYLLDGRLDYDNNRAERAVKPFVIGRKNFLFCNSICGAESSSLIYSIIETAKENQLDPYRYLLYILETAPNLDQSKEDWVTPLLPENAPEVCKAYKKNK